MEYIKVVLTSLSSFIVLFLITKLTGNRQVSQLSTFDYITGITIGSIAAEMASNLEQNLLIPLIAMAVFGITTVLLEILACKSLRLRSVLDGKCYLLFEKGKLYRNNFKRAKLDFNEFMSACRNKGYFDLSQIQSAVWERNGTVSIMPYCTSRPVTTVDLNIQPPDDEIKITVIFDGIVVSENLRYIGRDENWLNKQLKNALYDLSDVSLAICGKDGNISFFLKTPAPPNIIL